MKVLFAAILLAAVPAHAQSVEEDLAKYWALRDRLTSEFLTTGTDPGDAIPAVHRNDLLAYLKWADGTVQLGWYLGVLAAEHRLLSDPATWPGFDAGRAGALAANEAELHDALAALERLDLAGELGYPCPPLPLLNGFFVRDDVPADHHTAFPGMNLTLSDSTDIALYNKEMSQDQVYHLFLGLALVKHLVPPGVLVGSHDLNAWAIEQTDRIATKLITVDGWILHNPVCDKDVDRGADARAYSGGTVAAVAFVTGTVHPPAGLDAWSLMDTPLNPAWINADNLHMAMAIAAVGEGWGNDTLDVLLDLAALHDWYAYPMLYATLHDATPHPQWATHQANLVAYGRMALGELPSGEEPRSPRPLTATHGWTSWNRYLRPRADHYAGADGSEGQRFHGLDYLLLHNLVYLVDPAAWTLTAGPTDTGTGGTPPATGTPPGTPSGAPTGAPTGTRSPRAADPDGCGCGGSDGAGRPALAGLILALLPRSGRRARPLRSRSSTPR